MKRKLKGFFMLSLFFKAFFTGFFAACLVGPIFTLILYRVVTNGTRAGVLSALGMSLADGIFFCFSVVGNIYGKGVFLAQMKSFEFVGGPLMVFFGLWTLLRRGVLQDKDDKNNFSGNSLVWYTLSVLFLTLANPLTLLFFGSIVSQLFPELICVSYKLIFFAGFFISCGSFSLLLCAIFFIKRQKHVSVDVLVGFFKLLSGLGLLFMGGLLTFKTWLHFRDKYSKERLVCIAPKKLSSILRD